METNNKLREALEAINCIDTRGLKYLLCQLVEADIFDGGLINKTIAAVEKARRALSAPLRNCDVGTAEEQVERFKSTKCDKLPKCSPWDECCLTCFAKWAQMPYDEKGENNGSK